MTRDPIERRKRIKVALATLAVGLIISFLLALALIYMGRDHARF